MATDGLSNVANLLRLGVAVCIFFAVALIVGRLVVRHPTKRMTLRHKDPKGGCFACQARNASSSLSPLGVRRRQTLEDLHRIPVRVLDEDVASLAAVSGPRPIIRDFAWIVYTAASNCSGSTINPKCTMPCSGTTAVVVSNVGRPIPPRHDWLLPVAGGVHSILPCYAPDCSAYQSMISVPVAFHTP